MQPASAGWAGLGDTSPEAEVALAGEAGLLTDLLLEADPEPIGALAHGDFLDRDVHHGLGLELLGVGLVVVVDDLPIRPGGVLFGDVRPPEDLVGLAAGGRSEGVINTSVL